MLQIDYLIGVLSVILNRLIIIPVVLQVGDIPRLHRCTTIGQIGDDRPGRCSHHLIASRYWRVKSTSIVRIGIFSYFHPDKATGKPGNDCAYRRPDHSIASIVWLIKHTGIITEFDILECNDDGSGGKSRQEEPDGMPGGPVYIWPIRRIIVMMVGIIPAAAPDMRRSRIGGTVRPPSGRPVMDGGTIV